MGRFEVSMNLISKIWPFLQAEMGRWSVWRRWALPAWSTSFSYRNGSWLSWCWTQGNLLNCCTFVCMNFFANYSTLDYCILSYIVTFWVLSIFLHFGAFILLFDYFTNFVSQISDSGKNWQKCPGQFSLWMTYLFLWSFF